MPDETNPTGGGSTPPQKPSASTDPGQSPAPPSTGAPLPTASVEPEAQVTAPMTNPLSDASIKPAAPSGGEKGAGSRTSSLGGDGAPDLLPPRSSYEMPDEYADTWLTSARRWVEEHPGLAVAAAAGVGLVIGRIVVGMSSAEPEPTLVGKVEQRARAMRKELRRETKDLLKDARSALKDVRVADSAEAMQAKLRQAAAALAAATEHAGGRAGEAMEEGVERGRDLADSLSDAVRTAVSGVVTKAVDEWTARRR